MGDFFVSLGPEVQAALWTTAEVLLHTMFLWLPLLIGVGAFRLWMTYIRLHFIQQQGHTLLEVHIPAEVHKSPRAMELVLTQLHQAGSAKNFIETFWDGKVRPWFSLELVSIDGNVHFFVWTQNKWKNLVESQLYAQYPNVEIYEVPDYAVDVVHDRERLEMWGSYFILQEKSAYPIKTYIDYGMDKQEGAEEEEKIDPMTPVIEYLGQLKRGEQTWIQILIQAHRKEKTKDGRIIPREDWRKEIQEEIKKKREELKDEVPSITGDGTVNITRAPTKGESATIEAMERAADKWPFEVMIRGFYIATKEAFNSSNIPGLIGVFRQFSSPNMNGFKPGWFTDFDHPWKDYRRIRRNAIERQMLDAYKMRSFFWPPYRHYNAQPYILTTEELATLWHIPGAVATTPTFARIPSRKAEAPTNLPT